MRRSPVRIRSRAPGSTRARRLASPLFLGRMGRKCGPCGPSAAHAEIDHRTIAAQDIETTFAPLLRGSRRARLRDATLALIRPIPGQPVATLAWAAWAAWAAQNSVESCASTHRRPSHSRSPPRAPCTPKQTPVGPGKGRVGAPRRNSTSGLRTQLRFTVTRNPQLSPARQPEVRYRLTADAQVWQANVGGRRYLTLASPLGGRLLCLGTCPSVAAGRLGMSSTWERRSVYDCSR